MTVKLERIRYNVKDRGRQFLGQERNFDIPKLVKSINGGACQERIRTRGMLGYYGHSPRILAGMDSIEGAVIKGGKYTEFEPAVLTTFIKAYDNGDIEHQSEFLSSESGKKAAIMYADKVGGFSTAIKPDTYELSGIDWVFSPNYNANRPYILDSTASITMTDIVEAVARENDDFWQALIAKKDNVIAQLSDALNFAAADNEKFIDQLVTGKPILDDAGFLLPLRVSNSLVNQRERDRELFMSAKLPTVIDEKVVDTTKALETARELISRARG